MASTINASITGNGILQSADASGVLELQSDGTTGLSIGPGGVVTVSNDIYVSGTTIKPMVLGTVQNTTSGINIDFTGIPSWAKRITVMFNGVSTNGTSGLITQLIVGGTPVTTGYIGATDHIITGLAPAAHTTGFGVSDVTTGAAYAMNGCLVWNKFSETAWNGSFTGSSISAGVVIGAGYVPVSGAVTGVRITTLSATNTFDAGTINIMYE